MVATTGAAKLVSSFGSAAILAVPDPIFGLPYRALFWIVGTFELIAAAICFSRRQVRLQVGILAWLGANFLVYRLALLWVGYHGYCHCLGTLTETIHLSPRIADRTMEVVVLFLCLGGLATGFSIAMGSLSCIARHIHGMRD